MSILPAAIMGGASLLGGLGSGFLSFLGQKKTNRQNLQITQNQNAFNLAQWQREMAYNTPANQMKRLREAGLNPHLVYGTGSVTGNTTGNAPRAEGATMQNPLAGLQAPEFMGVLGDYIGIKEKNAQIDNIKANNEYIENKAINEGIKTSILGVDKLSKKLNYKQKNELYDTQVQMTKAQLQKVRQDVAKLSIETQRSNQSLQMEKSLKDLNLTPQDAAWLRLLKQYYDKNKGKGKKYLKNLNITPL